ncbi:hypothetical protein ACHQM5_003334 [Ranunculus cassubicifolius]
MGEEAFTLAPIVGFNLPVIKKKRNLPGTPDPEAEVIALSPKTLMATNRFVCEICGKGFQRDQNLQLHRRGHNVPWKLRQRSSKEPKKRVYVCPEITCVHHQPLRALGDLTGIKKHFCRKHGEKKWKCEKCSKRYAVQSDWKAHLKTCGTREYRCDCGTIFSRRDSFLTHRAFCDALAEETARVTATASINNNTVTTGSISYHSMVPQFSPFTKPVMLNNAAIDLSRSGIVPWMEQGSPDILQTSGKLSQTNPILGSMSLGTLYGDPYASSLNFQQTDYHFDWALGSSPSTVSSGEQITTTSLPLSAPSLYSTQNHLHQESQANMSATALLQKAAQIGATSSTPSLLLSFGVKCCNNPGQDGENRTESFGTKRKLSCVAADVDNSEDDISAMNLWEMYPSKRCNLQKDDRKDGQTRDFLGVGVQPICTPSINRYI